MKRSGFADLPLHNGRVPEWLASRMSRLGRAISEAVIMEYGKAEYIKRLSDPLWFQSLGCVMGMDWHSSGITTSVMGALKRSLNPISKDLGIYVCGGRGKHSRKTPAELYQVGMQTGLDGLKLGRASRLSAKVDNNAIQDGFQIYLHSFVVSDEGDWSVIQQGMNSNTGFARRYHWHSQQLTSFIEDPHTWICGENQGSILNLTDQKADPTRQAVLELSKEKPLKLIQEIRKIKMPAHHDVRSKNVDLKRLGSVIALANETEISNFEDLMLLKGLGPRTLQSLTLVSEVIYGTESRFSDPARFSFAHGGKDGHPFPVPTKVYDETIDTLDKAIQLAKLGLSEKQNAIKSLHGMAAKIEKNFIPNDQFDALIEKEKQDAPKYGGRTVFDDPPRKKKKGDNNQLKLF